MSRRPEPHRVLGLVGQYPVAGVAWQAVPDPRHRAAARRIAAERFGAERVRRRLLADAGLR